MAPPALRNVQRGRRKKKSREKVYSLPHSSRKAGRERKRSNATKGPSCQPLPVLIKQPVRTPTSLSLKNALHSARAASRRVAVKPSKKQQPQETPAAHRCGARAGPSRNPAPGQEAHKTGPEAVRTFPGRSTAGLRPPSSTPPTAMTPQQELHFLC